MARNLYLRLLFGLVVLLPLMAKAQQCPTAAFSIGADTVCVNQPVPITNTSVGASSYNWDFCGGNGTLSNPTGLTSYNLPTGAAYGQDMVYDGTTWHSFIVNTGYGSITRLDYTSGLDATPTATTFNTPNLTNGYSIAIVKEDNGVWSGIVSGIGGSNSFLHLNFGTSLTNVPTMTGPESIPTVSLVRGIQIVKENSSYYLVIAGGVSNTISVVNFGNSIANPITAANTSTYTFSGKAFSRFRLVRNCNNWVGLMGTSEGGAVYKVTFTNTIFSEPSIQAINIGSVQGSTFYDVSFFNYSNHYYGLIASYDNAGYLLDFASLQDNSPAVSVIPSIGTDSKLIGLSVAKHNGYVYVFCSSDYSPSKILRVRFGQMCPITATNDTDAQPTVSYTVAGKYTPSLFTYGTNTASDTVVVVDNKIKFSIAGSCNNPTFTFTNFSCVGAVPATYLWDFGDGNTATTPNATHTYSSSNQYTVTLKVKDANNVEYTQQQTLLYQAAPPVADFTYTSPVCSGGENIFTETSISSIDTVVSWNWDLGNNTTANTKSAAAIYTTPGTYNVTLTIQTANGCTSSVTKQVSVVIGPTVKFGYQKVCIGDTVSFTDSTFFPAGVTYLQGSRLWTFGDNTTDTTQNPKHKFAAAQTYSVALRVISTDGCISTFTRNVTVLPLPVVDFSIPSLIFPNTSVPFTDNTVVTGAQTVVDWQWDFGEPSSGANNTSTAQNPTHVFASPNVYMVTLTVTTNKGCKQSITKSIEILRNCPETNFSLSSNTPNIAENITATSNSSASVSKYQWDLCAGDLSKIPMLEQPFTTSYTVQNVSLFSDKGKNYLFAPFVGDIPNTPWQRFDFGQSFNNNPTMVVLGNPPNGTTPNALNRPVCIRVFRKDTAVYGLAINASTGGFVRLFFADSVDSDNVTASSFVVPGITKPENIEIVQDGDSLYAFVTCNTGSINNLLVRLSFGKSFSNTPVATILDNTILQNNNSGALLGMSLIRDCNTWYMVVVSNTGKIIRLNFGLSLNNSPSFQNVTTQWTAGFTELIGSNTLVKVSLHKDLGYIYGLGVTKLGVMVNFKFSSLAANPISKQIWSSNTFVINNMEIRDAQFIKVGSEWHGFASYLNSNLGVLKWSFPNPCSTSQPIRNQANISGFSYAASGKYYITLEASDARGWSSAMADSVTINTNTSPEVGYTCPAVGAAVPTAVCANQEITVTANTSASNNVAWDMCAGDLNENILFESSAIVQNVFVGHGMSIVKEGTEYFGLIAANYVNSPIVFARFGSNLNNGINPYIYNSGVSALSCNDAKMVKENGKWIGFLSNAAIYNSTTNQILRLNWGANLLTSNSPQLSMLSGKGQLNVPDGIEIAEENGQKYLFVVNTTPRTIVVYNFGNSYLNTPSISSFVVDSAVSAQRISMIKDCNRWYALVSDQQGSAVIKLDFHKGLSQKPIASRIYMGSGKYPMGLKLWRDNGKFYAIVVSYSNNQNNHYKITFGDKMANTPTSITDMGNNSGLANDMVGFDIVRTDDSKTSLIGVSLTDIMSLYKFRFPNPCATATPIVSNTSSSTFAYTQNGNYNIAITATDTNGNAYSLGYPIQVKNPVSADFSPSGVFCKGQTVNFTHTSIVEPNTQGLTYSWTFDDPSSGANTATTQDASHIFAEAGTYNVTYNVGSGTGCSSIKQKVIKIYNAPQANFTFQNISIGLCANDSIAFTDASTIDVGDQINVYQWTVKDIDQNLLFTSAKKNPKFFFTNTGVYSVTLTVIGNGGCPNEVTKTVDVTNLGAAVTIGVSNDFCAGSVVSYTAGIVDNSDTTTVFWDLGDNQTSTELNPTITYSSSGTRTVMLRVTNSLGCESTTYKSVTIYSRPEAVINTNTAACRNSPLILSATSSISEGLISNYVWSFGDGTPNQNAATVSHTYTNVGLYNVRLIITTQYGCKDTADVMISVAPSPTAAFSAQSICVNKPVAFTNQSSSIGGSLTYLWQFRNAANTADLGTSTLANPTFTFTTAGTYPVILTVQDGQCSNTTSQNIVISGIPQASISIEEGCVGTPFTFHDNSTYPTPSDVPVAWFWTITQNSQIVQTMTTQNPQVLLPAGTGYSVQLKVFTQKGCEAASPIFSFPVAAPPVAAFNVLTTTFTGAPFNVSFQNTSSNAINYLWDFGDGQTSTETNPTHTFAAEGLYLVTLKAIRNACSDTATHSAGVFINISKGVRLSNLSVTGTESLTIAARIQNESNVELNTLTMKAQTSDGLTIQETWTGSILPNASLVYTFGTKLNVRNNNVVPFVCAETQLPNPAQEITPDNNSACQVLSSNSFLLAVSPVPANQTLNIRYLVAQADEVTIELIDMLGKRVFVEEKGTMAAGKYEQDIDLQQMTVGMYYLRLIVGKQKVGEKVSVQH